MKTKKLLMTAALALISFSLNAQTIALGITFHFPNSGPSDNSLAETVCQINQNFAQLNNGAGGTDIHFYIHNIVRSFGSTGGQQNNAVSLSPKQGHINIYECCASGAGSHNPQLDAIFVASANLPTVLTHEIGHMLALAHTDGSGNNYTAVCSNLPCISGNDCCGDTPYNEPNNWMGSNKCCGFTVDQSARMRSCINARGWSTWGGFGAIGADYNNAVPIPDLQPDGLLTFAYPQTCPANTVTSVDITVSTTCPYGSVEMGYNLSLDNISQPVYLDVCRGISAVKYVFHYQGTTQTNRISRTYNYKAYSPSGNICSCTIIGGGNSKFSNNIGNVAEETAGVDATPSAYFRLVNTIAQSELTFNSAGYTSVTVLDMSGRNLQHTTITDGQNKLDVSSLPAGLYLVTATDGKTIVREKFQKQ